MLGSIGARAGAALALSVIVLSALAAPVSAASRTRWVDDDHKNGDGPRACNNANFHSIQAAVDASSAGDKIFVCPGTYEEQVIVDTPNLLIQSRPTRSAIITPPEAQELQEVDSGFDVVDILANRVSFVGFKINIPAGGTVNAALPETCIEMDSAIYATGTDLNIKANAIKAVGDASLSGECGYLVGIGLIGELSQPGLKASMTAAPSDVSDISRNRIVDFKMAGVLAEGAHTRIYNNSIRFIHANDPATCVIVPVLGVRPSLTFPCDFETANAPHEQQVPFDETAGIVVEFGYGDVRNNSVYSTFDFATCEIECDAFLGFGVLMIETDPGSKARNNRVNNTAIGMVIGFPELGPIGAKASAKANLPPAPNGTQVTGNRTNETFVGMMVNSSNNVLYGNRSHLNIFGVVVLEEAADNVFDSNDFRYNLAYDCDDESTGTGTLNTANNWDAPNFGEYNNPDGLCIETGLPI
jgi:hypothetical protein